MTKEEARELTLKHLWSSLPSKVKDLIEESCLNGEFSVTLDYNIYSLLSKENIEALIILGYNVINDDYDDPFFIISWR